MKKKRPKHTLIPLKIEPETQEKWGQVIALVFLLSCVFGVIALIGVTQLSLCKTFHPDLSIIECFRHKGQ